MNQILMKSLIDALLFFEFSNEEILNPDSAIEIMESIAINFQEMNQIDIKIFLETLESLELNSYTQEEINFIRNLPEFMGIE
ncbi:hypothetical protein PL75_04175 [Neisseria arctica]|uniref:Uncharacterized protein n=1 Tax=Neisseria arctica TaxID=1470200 RepID=A0A0J0YSM8_9NEIS|nr:hypothetical protein [Neisseria arctica]KLT73114.1 hypothetical protein PL75_04175 [Neisseria arctica]UOO87160.1 hypothetical protein LVJ86_02605 [Neisseria arctica]